MVLPTMSNLVKYSSLPKPKLKGVFCIFSKTSSAGSCNYFHIYLLTSLGDNSAILWLQNYGSLKCQCLKTNKQKKHSCNFTRFCDGVLFCYTILTFRFLFQFAFMYNFRRNIEHLKSWMILIN